MYRYRNYYSFRLNSFADVEQRYNSVKPIRGSDNIRPVADRRRKFEHVYKFSDSCYGLFNASMGDPLFCGYIVTPAEAMHFAPILWTRDADGTERIRIRNGTGDYAHTATYGFLHAALPKGLLLKVANGKQSITQGANEYYLAKGTTLPAWKPPTHSSLSRGCSTSFDNVALTFVYTQDGWKFDGDEVPSVPRVTVDRTAKAKYKEHITQFWNWVCTIAPMLPMNDWQYVNDKDAELREYTYTVASEKRENLARREPTCPDVALKIIQDYDSPYRLHLAISFLTRSDLLRVEGADDIGRVRSQYNRWINKTLGFNKIC